MSLGTKILRFGFDSDRPWHSHFFCEATVEHFTLFHSGRSLFCHFGAQRHGTQRLPLLRNITFRMLNLRCARPLAILSLVTLRQLAFARSWLDVADVALFAVSPMDPNRLLYSGESDPFLFPTPNPTTSPFSGTITTPTSRPVANVVAAPSTSEQRSNAPSARWENRDGNGGCQPGRVLHEVVLQDFGGDEQYNNSIAFWTMPDILPDERSETSSTAHISGPNPTSDGLDSASEGGIELFKGSWKAGEDSFSYICLQPAKCYQMEVEGGLGSSDATWEVRKVEMGISRDDRNENMGAVVAKGFVPEKCEFSILNEETDALACPLRCNVSPETPAASFSSAPASALPTALFSDATEKPNPLRSTAPSDGPSLIPSDVPSYVPSYAPSIVPSEIPSSNVQSGFGTDQRIID